MTEFAYAAARAVAPAIHAHLRHHLQLAAERHERNLSSLPSEETLAAMVDVAFWASLRREEGYLPRISLAAVTPGETPHPLHFDRPLPLDAAVLTRVAPAVERPGVHLAVADYDGQLVVWGIARTMPKYACVVEVSEPGLLVVKHHRGEELAKYANLAVLQGDRVSIVDEQASTLPDCPALLSTLLGFESAGAWVGSMGILVQLAVSMRAHRRGGLLLVVPSERDEWRASIVQPVLYEVRPPFGELGSLTLPFPAVDPGGGVATEVAQTTSRDELARAIDAVAGLTAVDGATVLTSDYQLLAFGAKVTRREGASVVEQVTVTEPIRGGRAAIVNPSQIGGTRHLAGAQFVQDQPDAVALVASQDGRFTIFAWSPCEAMVHAHRVEALLL
jgi:hypothetical protein